MKYLDWVDAYLSGELPEAQQKEFEAALADSAELQGEVALARKVLTAVAIGVPDETAENIVRQTAERHRQERDLLFQQYHTGTLLAAERIQFEKRLAEDELLAFEWGTYQKAHPVLKAKKVQIVWMRWALAASVTLLLGFFSWWLMKMEDNSEKLLAKYDVAELFPRTQSALVDDGLLHKGIVGSDEFEQTKLDGLQAFDDKDWPRAIQLLSEYQQNTKPSAEDMPDEINLLGLYIGRAWYEQHKPVKAVAVLQASVEGVVDTINYGRLQELMRWHLVLAHLQNRDPSAAKLQLEMLRNARRIAIREQTDKLLAELK